MASDESARNFIDYTFRDIHHSRLQNWTGITVVTAFHFGILKISEYLMNNNKYSCEIKFILFSSGALFCLIGFMITRVHQRQLYEKLQSIKNAEVTLDTYKFRIEIEKKTESRKKSKLLKYIRKNFLTAGSLIGYFYILLMILDLLCISYSLK